MTTDVRKAPFLPVAVLCCLGFAAVWLPFLHVAPNRLLSGVARSPHEIVLAVAWLAVAGLAWFIRSRTLAIACVSAMVVALPWLAGHDAGRLLDGAAPTSRVQTGAGFWTMWLAAGLLLLDRLRGLSLRWRAATWAAIALAVLSLAMGGAFGDIAIVREYRAQRGVFIDAFWTHVALSGTTLLLALAIGLPLGAWAWRAKRAGGVLLGVFSFLQTVPSLALFALLIGPFAWLARAWPALGALGFGGTGAAPAVFALVLYALLPVLRYTVTGLDAAPADARDAARGLGMSRWHVLARIQVPLGLPVLLSGLRIVAVQTVGLAAVASLIGAGGLGRFVFLGIGQGATDMVLLGTLAIIALAFAMDLLFQGLHALAEVRA
ncbi:MAG: Glycine betaine uptake system permease protein YehY [Luteibacter sp.]|uniref:ABC transporter permease n=1 Tax=Luteibacter sp. TaxID=1886636 RepID=UPI00137FA07C|nr:ABC transporter permease [Luteibacter sp.]KAF1003989.1 MAG: Glycine betaine uptake system permease protein YehY [Luteibacter sp.]